jgi:hypothetical protein
MKCQTNKRKKESKMIQTKSQLISDYRKGLLKEVAYDCTVYHQVFRVIYCDDETIFGYSHFSSEPKKFFKVKLYWNEENPYFYVNGVKHELNNIIRF